MSTITRYTFEDWKRKNRILRLKRAIHTSFNKDTFIWQTLCRKMGNTNIHLLRQQAKIFGLESSNILSIASKRKLCILLAQASEPMLLKLPNMEGIDLCGNNLNEHPSWKLYSVNGITFNILDLIKLINDKQIYCPYTRLPLPTKAIIHRGKFLEKILTQDALNEFNLLEQVKETPLLTKETELQTMLINKVWSRLNYAPNVQIIMNAPDTLIDDMIYNLFRLTDDSYLLYPMLSYNNKNEMLLASDLRKKELFIQTLITIVSVADEWNSVRLHILNILFSHYNDDGTTRNDSNDLLSFMLEEPSYFNLFYFTDSSSSEDSTR